MSDSTTIDFREIVQALLNEDSLFSLRERRCNARQSFVRPVTVQFDGDHGQPKDAFTRDLSGTGIGLIHKFPIDNGTQAVVTIHRLWDEPFILRCESCWCQPSQQGWLQSGWKILSVVNAPT